MQPLLFIDLKRGFHQIIKNLLKSIWLMKKERTYQLSCDNARNISIVKTLSSMNYFPTRQTEKEAWYLSPFRRETTASFKVSILLNRWYDHGEGIGGNCIDLICKIKNCSAGATLQFLEGTVQQIPEPILKLTTTLSRKLIISEVKILSHPFLLKYLDKRKTPLRIAQKYCREVHYLWSGRSYFSIGLKNKSDGWELRNSLYKNGTSPKDITLILNGHLKKLAIVEGIFDLLSLEVYLEKAIGEYSIIVLNSIAFAKRADTITQQYDEVHLFLDRDEAGKRTTENMMSNHPNTIDMSELYEGFQDLNDWIVNKVK